GVFVEDQVQTLRKACEVQVLVPYGASLREVLRFLVGRRGRLQPVQRLPTPSSPLGLPLRTLVFVCALGRVCAGRGEAVVHVHLIVPDALPMLVAARLRGWPVVVSEHVNFLGELMRSRRARLQARAVLRWSDAVLPVSRALEKELHELE